MAKRFSIRYKFLAVSMLLLVLCLGAYLTLASREFRIDKTQLVFDLNRGNVTNLASELDTLLRGVSDKMQLLSRLWSKGSGTNSIISDLLNQDPDIAFVGVSEGYIGIDRELFVQPTIFGTYDLKPDFFSGTLPERRPIPFDQIREKGEALWNASAPGGPPLIGVGRSVLEEGDGGRIVRQYAVLAFVKADRIMKSIAQSQLSEVFVTTPEGHLLVHPDPKILFSENFAIPELIRRAGATPAKTSVVEFTENGRQVLAAFSRAHHDHILVLSRVDGEKAFAVVRNLVRRSLMLAGILATLSFLAATFLSRSLTRPIDALVGGMNRVAEGNLETNIEIRSKDEIALLAGSFNSMIREIRDSRQQLVEINRDLELKVQDRTRELEKQNRAVKEAQEALLRTTRLAAVGEIAGQAAHEVLNPLTSILTRAQRVHDRLVARNQGDLDLLVEIVKSWKEEHAAGGFAKLTESWNSPSSVLPGETLWQEDIHNINHVTDQLRSEFEALSADTDFITREGQRINRIVNSMRSLSIVRADLKPHEAESLVKRSVDIMADLARAQKVEMNVVIEAPNALVMVDEDEFIQVLTNLIRNSLQAIGSLSTPRLGRIEFKIKRQAEDPATIVIQITDNGVGVPQENHSRLFETHFTTKSRSEGSGLGLKISRRFIRAFHGDLHLTWSEVNEGTTLQIHLPEAQPTQKLQTAAS